MGNEAIEGIERALKVRKPKTDPSSEADSPTAKAPPRLNSYGEVPIPSVEDAYNKMKEPGVNPSSEATGEALKRKQKKAAPETYGAQE